MRVLCLPLLSVRQGSDDPLGVCLSTCRADLCQSAIPRVSPVFRRSTNFSGGLSRVRFSTHLASSPLWLIQCPCTSSTCLSCRPSLSKFYDDRLSGSSLDRFLVPLYIPVFSAIPLHPSPGQVSGFLPGPCLPLLRSTRHMTRCLPPIYPSFACFQSPPYGAAPTL